MYWVVGPGCFSLVTVVHQDTILVYVWLGSPHAVDFACWTLFEPSTHIHHTGSQQRESGND